MDTEMLDLILDEQIDFCGVSKNNFLGKINSIFTQIKLSGEPGSLKLFRHSKIQNQFYLGLSVLSYFVKFILDFDENGAITAFSNPVTVNSRTEVINLGNLCIYFPDDEKRSFRPDDKYLLTVHKCNCACSELITEEKLVITSSDLHRWLDKYLELYITIEHQYRMGGFDPFFHLYDEMQSIKRALDVSGEVHKAIQEFYPKIDGTTSDFTSIQTWINRYRGIAFSELMCIEFSFDKNRSGPLIRTRQYENLFFLSSEVKFIFDFNDLYHTYFNNSELSGLYEML